MKELCLLKIPSNFRSYLCVMKFYFFVDAGIGHIDDLSSLLDIESNFNTEDFIPNLPDELHVSSCLLQICLEEIARDNGRIFLFTVYLRKDESLGGC